MTIFKLWEEDSKYNFLEDSMIGLGLIGLLLMVFALIYFVIYLLKKVRGRNPILSKKIFYFSLIGGFLLMILSASFLDTGQGQLQEANGKNSKLESEVKELKTKAKELEAKVVELESDKEKLTTALSDTEAKLSDSKDQEKEFAEYKKSQEEKIADLESEKEELEEKVNNLEDKVAEVHTPSSSSTETSKSGSSSNNSNATASTVNSGNNNFANCTELRSVYPNGVPSSHPAYQSKMDRDKDNYACER